MPTRCALRALTLAGFAACLPRAAVSQSTYEELQRFSAVLNQIRTNYADSVTYQGLVKAAINGMLESLDPHSWFASAEDAERLSKLERGELAATGIVFEMVDGAPTVFSLVPKSPALKAGVQPGDRIAAIDGVPATGLPEKSVALRLAGEKGSRVAVRLARGSRLEPDTFSVTLKRVFLEHRNVTVSRLADPQTGYVYLAEFGDKSGDEMSAAVKRLRSLGAKRLILDLRWNPGGIVTEAVAIASQFFPGHTLVFSTKGRKRDANAEFRTKGGGDFVDLPLIVLVNQGSASAAEALAGSLQDHDRALIMGRRSFGKALMQTAFYVPNGMIMLTIGHVVSPSGRVIQRRYQGIAIEEYRAFAGNVRAEDDTLQLFHTGNGREVRGGGGIAPDVPLPKPVDLPAWWSIAADSAFDDAVSDSVALTLPATPGARAQWIADSAAWQAQLLPPFLARVRARLGVAAQPDDAVRTRLGRILAARVTEVRWGTEAREEFLVRNDQDVQAALTYFPRLKGLLGPVTGNR